MSTHDPALARRLPPADAPAQPTLGHSAALSDCAPLGSPADERGAEARWTRARQVAFLRHLAASHSVAAAARAVGMSRQSAYSLRARLKGQPFDRAWAAAFDSVFNALAHAAMERALYGVEVPYLHKGEVVHVGRKFDERLTLGLLRMRHALLPEHAEPNSDAAVYDLDDFPGLIRRVENGPEEWGDS